jgi:hypothetical protein
VGRVVVKCHWRPHRQPFAGTITCEGALSVREESMDEVRVSSWDELNERLYEGSWNPSLGRFRSTFAFRGVEIAVRDLRTSLARLGGDYPELERHLLRNFVKYAYREVGARGNFWETLALAQHHGLPTRLLDWTYSPYVAMHFATANVERFHRDAVIWCIDFVASNRFLPKPLQTLLDREGADVFTAEMLTAAARDLAAFDALAEETFLVFFEPPSLDARIVNQFALFSLMSSATARLDRWLRDHPGLARRLIIPSELKWEIRDKLDQANITERVLFPGLDGLSKWLKRHYSPRTVRSPLVPDDFIGVDD